MRKAILAVLCVAMTCGPAVGAKPAPGDYLTWTRLPDLPDAEKEADRLGRAGMFAGVHNDALILAGGANFPTDRLKGGKKTYYKDIFVLVKAGEDEADALGEVSPDGKVLPKGPRYRWIRPDVTLDHGLAYGVAIPTDAGLVCIGGEWQVHGDKGTETFFSDEVFVLTWDPKTKTLAKTDRLVSAAEKAKGKAGGILPLPPLPEACSCMAGAKVDDVIYIAGGKAAKESGGEKKKTGSIRSFWALDLSKKTDPNAFKWKRLDPWAGESRQLAVAAAQSDGDKVCFYLFGGRNVQPPEVDEAGKVVMPGVVRWLTDAWRYNPKTGRWRKLPDVGVGPGGDAKTDAAGVAAGAAVAFGDHHILVIGGGMAPTLKHPVKRHYIRQMAKLSDLEARAAAETEPAARAELTTQAHALAVELDKTHPGFQRNVRAFHTLTETWSDLREMPTRRPPVTTPAVRWGPDIVIPSGEIRPGVRSPVIWRARAKEGRASFGAVNWTVLALYMASLLAMGVYFSRREKTTGDFFLGGRRIPWWAAGLSIYGTQLSAITFMAIPATTYRFNWLPIVGNWLIIPTCLFVALLIAPFYSRLKVTTAYEYLERRFSVVVRLYGSLVFILMQLGRMGIVVFLPSMTLAVVTGIDIYTCIAIMGVLCTIYTVMGGIEAVVWTDVLQVAILTGGAIISLFVLAGGVEGGFGGIFTTGMANSKFDLAILDWDCTQMVLWVVLLGMPLSHMVPYTADQTVVQRYLTTRSPAQARNSLLTTCCLVGPMSLVFFGIGTALFAFYKANPHLLDPGVTAKAIFPYFILQNLPAGVAGLVIAAVFAASMSSLDSSMNSIATAVTTDFYRRFRPGAADRRCLALARWITVIAGVLGTAIALVMAYHGESIKDIWFLFIKILGLMGGGLAGVFLLGMFTRRATAIGALAGAIAGAAVQGFAVYRTRVHWMLYAAIGLVVCVVVGYLVSVIVPVGRKDLAGLTVYSTEEEAAP